MPFSSKFSRIFFGIFSYLSRADGWWNVATGIKNAFSISLCCVPPEGIVLIGPQVVQKAHKRAEDRSVLAKSQIGRPGDPSQAELENSHISRIPPFLDIKNTEYFYNSKPYIVHRLDKETSGAMIIAKN